jgi:threonine dehydratase
VSSIEAKRTLPSLAAIKEASHRIEDIAYRTPLYYAPSLSRMTGANIYLKLESYQPIRVFKIRGAANKILQLSPEERKRGLVAASSGNHGVAVSYVAKLTGTKATIVVPTTAVEEKVRSIEEFGATVVKEGLFHDQRFAKALEIQKTTGAVLIPPFDDPDVIAGQGTVGLEIHDSLPNVDTVVVPIGGGGLISGVATAIKNLKPDVQVYGVEPERASSMHDSLKEGKTVRLIDTTSIADGLATREPGQLTFECAKKYVKEVLLVSEEDIEKAVFTTLKECHLLIEPSAAAAVAAVLGKLNPKKEAKIVVVVSGGNISLRLLQTILSKYS